MGTGKGLQFSVTSPAGSPSPQGYKNKNKNNYKHKYQQHNNIKYRYDGVTADELLQLISYGHADEIDTDYDTDNANNDIYTYINNDYSEYISETPSPQEHLRINVDDDDDDTYSTIYGTHRLKLLGNNSANYSNLSNISNISTSLSSIHQYNLHSLIMN